MSDRIDAIRERATTSAAEDWLNAKLAEAWDEGFDKGFYDPLAGRTPQRDASESAAANPYRKEQP